MIPIWIAVFFIAVFMAYTASDAPKKEAETSRIVADISATNFLSYRRAVQSYLAANPGVGDMDMITAASLMPYWPTGYVLDPNWKSMVSDGVLYVYSSTAPAANTLAAIHDKSRENLLLGTKDPVTGRLKSYNGFDTGIHLPAGIPNNAIVMIGR